MANKLSPVFNDSQFIDGIPAVGAKVFTYQAGSTTPLTTYADEAGTTPNPNPVILNARGEPPQPFWLIEGQSYKFVFTSSTDTDPPNSPIRTLDNIIGVGDNMITVSQWQSVGVTPTYINATTFTIAGDQTGVFTVGLRVKINVTAGTVYGTITNSVYNGSTITTITVQLDSGALDSGLSSVQIGLLTPDNSSIPSISDLVFRLFNFLDNTKKMAFDLAGITTGTTITLAVPDKNGTIALTSDVNGIFPRNFISGLQLSTVGASTTITAGIGSGSDSTNVTFLSLVAPIAKTTSAWAVGTGNGGLDTGSIANNTAYHFYLIERPDTGVKDIIFSLNATTPALPANYTRYRRIGAWITNASGQWISMKQDGDRFMKLSPTTFDIDVTNPGVSAVLRTLPIPLGIKLISILNAGVIRGTANVTALRVTDPDITASTALPEVVGDNASSTQYNGAQLYIETNTSGQVRTQLTSSVADTVLRISLMGWIDSRGKE